MKIAIDVSAWFEPGTTIRTTLGYLVNALVAAGPEHHWFLLYPDSARPGTRRRLRLDAARRVPPSANIEHAPGAVPGPLRRMAGGAMFNLWRSRWLERRGVDVVFFFHPTLMSFVPRKPRFAVATVIHDLIALRLPDFTKPGPAAESRRLLPWHAEHADMILAVSEATRQDIMHELRVGPERVKVLYQGIPAEFHPRSGLDHDGVCKRLRIPRKFILFVGRLDPWKNLGALLAAYRSLLKRNPGIVQDLVIAGPMDWGYPALSATVRMWGLEGRIHFTGRLSEDDLPLVYNLAGCFVFPSWHEGFGLPVVEAMASGCPVIISTTPALKEAAGGAALEVDPADVEGLGDSISKLLTEPRTRERLVEKGLERARQFSWEKTAMSLLEEFSTLTRHNGRRLSDAHSD